MFAKRLLTLPQSLTKRVGMLKQRIDQAPEGSRLYRWRGFWMALLADYKSVGKDIIQDCKEKPKKAFIITSGLVAMVTAIKTNPKEHCFMDQHNKNRTTLLMVADPIRNPVAEKHNTYLTTCINQGLLRCSDLVFFSVMWIADYDKDCSIYATHCKYLRPQFLTFYRRIVDVGLFGTWINLRLKMKDFDINPNEWDGLS
ncbi:uncharacterized protein CEXT_410801 [Caerostris extrusa]|uniref:Mitochondrial import inner membrane translocase subunit Tim29 n=1 Tax=Caerostris extrusa TaxID=172846 RepID=A0AAV4XXK2_CAEEX|nr:uncharacterized protein CEXT_410801 [Caerostris extrusa]